MRATRARAVEYMGGKCVDCGYHRHPAAFDFHHVDPSKKDPSFDRWRGWGWPRVEAELQHCVLLCRNCHAIRHDEAMILPS